ncbi:protein goliath-like isoform X2 [Nilaparvata lugens]|uniref:protein goliath-like isoform X2 n=1 Tax=Nilaparvata lugens TaxID=108931 RepID=UPI00193D7A93|nr:protein goliath-like isoform X2 [Nilaparvata lugens]
MVPRLVLAAGQLMLATLSVAMATTTDSCSTDWIRQSLDNGETSVAADSYTTAFINVTFRDPSTGRWHSETDEIGKFGGYHVGPAAGVLVHVIDAGGELNTACTLPLRRGPAPGFNIPAEPWIALVKRGGCNFQVKVDHALRYNASGVIVYNDRDKASLEKMKLAPNGNHNISAVFTYKWVGEELVRLMENGTRVYAHISIASRCTKPFNSINSLSSFGNPGPMIIALCGTKMPLHKCAMLTSVMLVSISFIVLMIISMCWLVFYYVQRFRYIHAKDRLSRRLCTAAKKALSKIPTKHIKSEDKGEGECCAICIEPYKTSEVVRILPCKHEFHRSCIDPWLLEHRTCPMCKMDILKHYGFVFTGSQESILHMDIEEAVSDSESMHQRSLSSPVPHLLQGGLTVALGPRSLTPDLLSHVSRASTPDEYSPALPGPSYEFPTENQACLPESGMHLTTSKSEFLPPKPNSQIRRSISLDNCDLPAANNGQ